MWQACQWLSKTTSKVSVPTASVPPNSIGTNESSLLNKNLCSQQANSYTTPTSYTSHLCTIFLSWSKRHKQVIKKCFKSEKAFRTYLTSTEHPDNMCCAFLAFTGLVNLYSESINKQEKLEKKVKE